MAAKTLAKSCSKTYNDGVNSSPRGEENIGGFQILVLLLSVLVLMAMVTDALLHLPPEISRLLEYFDHLVCAVFFIDFVARFRRAESKAAFMKWGWIDLIASIPNINVLRWGRMIRVLRVIRVLRGIRSFQKILAVVFRHKVKSGIGAIITTFGLLVMFASVAILVSETEPESNIKTAGDAIWWSVTTITTVGYGDKYPITTEGRMIAMALMISGVGLFGTLSGVVASLLLGANEESNAEVQKLTTEVRTLQQKIDKLARNATLK